VLPMPAYIAAAQVRAAPVKHKWTSSAPIDREAPKLWQAFNKTSKRSMLLLAAGTAEWVAWRFDGLTDVTDNLQFVEAAYAGVIDPAYVVRWHWPKGGDPKGAIAAPLAEANGILSEAVRLYEIGSMGVLQEGVREVLLAEHAVPKKKAFEDWFQAALKRLVKLYRFDTNDMKGPPVPREALDPAFAYDPKQATQLLRGFLQKLDPKANPYLRSAEDMIKTGFKGKPYTL
jgi:hypothetical protein